VTSPQRCLFVSHVSEDRSAALEIVAELERRGLHCWIAPRDVRPGRPYDDEIADAIDNSLAMLLVFSERCNESEYIRREVTVAGESQKVIIPFRIEDAPPRRGLRVRLSDLHWIDGFVSRDQAIEELYRTFNPTTERATPKLAKEATTSQGESARRIRSQIEDEHRAQQSVLREQADKTLDNDPNKTSIGGDQKHDVRAITSIPPNRLDIGRVLSVFIFLVVVRVTGGIFIIATSGLRSAFIPLVWFFLSAITVGCVVGLWRHKTASETCVLICVLGGAFDLFFLIPFTHDLIGAFAGSALFATILALDLVLSGIGFIYVRRIRRARMSVSAAYLPQ
jgi:hypothetical protein